ncbi:MAG: hypothetical protein AB8G77_09275 [Rhodothermales bacterium]
MAFWAFSWILIPIAGILFGAFKEWLSFKEKQLQLGESTEHLEAKVDELMKALKDSETEKTGLLSRVQNLETIVTSQVWDVLLDEDKSIQTKKLEIESIKPKITLPPEEDEAADKAERLARRLRI